jgi:hypothetical protein
VIPRKAWILGAAVLVVLIVVAGPVGRSLINHVGGQAKDRPWTSISVRDASVIRTGKIAQGQRLAFVVTNHSGDAKTYAWQATTAGRDVAHGFLRVPAWRASASSVSTTAVAPGSRLQITLVGQIPHLSIKVGSPY